MPEQELRPIYENVSVEELNNILDATPDMEEKLLLAQFYIMCYGAKGKPSCTPAQLVNAAKEKILQATVDAKQAFYKKHGYGPAPASYQGVNPGEIEVSQGPVFLKDPMTYMANMAKIVSISELPEDAPEDAILLKKNAAKVCDLIYNPNAIGEYQGMQKKNRADGLIAGIAKRQPGRNDANPDEILERHKGGFWERWRNKTSPEFIRFRETLKNVQDPKSEEYGNIDALERDAKAYLQHKIPGYNPDEFPTKAQIEALSGTGKGRAQLCLDVLLSAREQRNLEKSDEIYRDNYIEHSLVDLTPEEVENQYKQEMEEEANQEKEFAEEVGNDVEEEEPKVEEDNENEIENEPVEEKENAL